MSDPSMVAVRRTYSRPGPRPTTCRPSTLPPGSFRPTGIGPCDLPAQRCLRNFKARDMSRLGGGAGLFVRMSRRDGGIERAGKILLHRKTHQNADRRRERNRKERADGPEKSEES